MTTRHRIGHMVIAGNTPGNGTIDQLSSWRLNTNLEKYLEASDGRSFPTFATIGGAAPDISGQTTAIAQFLTLAGTDGLTITDGTLVAYLQKEANLATIAAGSVHRSFTVAGGLILPVSLSAGMRPPATLDFLILPTSADGSTFPIVHAASVALPSATTPDEAFVVGPWSINGTAIELQSFNYRFGWTHKYGAGAGYPYPTHLNLKRCVPQLEIVTLEGAVLDAVALAATVQGATDSKVYLRKCTANGAIRVADITAEHISLSIAAGLASLNDFGASTDDDAEFSVTYDPTYDGAAAIVAAAAGVAIT